MSYFLGEVQEICTNHLYPGLVKTVWDHARCFRFCHRRYLRIAH